MRRVASWAAEEQSPRAAGHGAYEEGAPVATVDPLELF